MEKDFDKWNSEKKLVDKKTVNRDLFFYAREIWWCSAGLNIGVEADGKNENYERPFLIIKKFNADMVWVLPLTTQEKINKYYFKLNYEELKSWVVLSQIKTISTKRLLRKVGSISESDFKEVVERLQNILI
ncbi:MAG: type II toxin-antitoxin system PemK/MazF family toxin [Patescibacteria group bacterium]